MSEWDLRTMAEDLEELLAEGRGASPESHLDESYFIAAEPEPTPEQGALDENNELLPELVRSIVEYALTRAPTRATADHIGEAISEGVATAVDKLHLDETMVVEAVDAFLTELCDSVRNSLSVE